MSKAKYKYAEPAIYVASALLISILSILTTWLVGVAVLAFYFYRIQHAELLPEGDFTSLILTYVGSLLIAPLGLIPAYLISMRLAEHLRERRNWVLKYPRRLFAISLLIPILFFILLSAFGRNS